MRGTWAVLLSLCRAAETVLWVCESLVRTLWWMRRTPRTTPRVRRTSVETAPRCCPQVYKFMIIFKSCMSSPQGLSNPASHPDRNHMRHGNLPPRSVCNWRQYIPIKGNEGSWFVPLLIFREKKKPTVFLSAKVSTAKTGVCCMSPEGLKHSLAYFWSALNWYFNVPVQNLRPEDTASCIRRSGKHAANVLAVVHRWLQPLSE